MSEALMVAQDRTHRDTLESVAATVQGGNLPQVTAASLGLGQSYEGMLRLIAESEQAVAVATAQHGKSHTQFQFWQLDMTAPVAGVTKLRNWRQALAVMERTRDALEDAALGVREHEARAAMLRTEQADTTSDEKAALLQVEIDRELCHAARTRRAMGGAVRKLAAYTEQFKELERQIRAELGKGPDEPITEEDTERDEERFHIKNAFRQALQAARAYRHTDHGNFIYFDELGISGAMANDDIREFLAAEALYRQHNPSHVHEVHQIELDFLEAMAKKYAGCSQHVVAAKGLLPGILESALLRLPAVEPVKPDAAGEL